MVYIVVSCFRNETSILKVFKYREDAVRYIIRLSGNVIGYLEIEEHTLTISGGLGDARND